MRVLNTYLWRTIQRVSIKKDQTLKNWSKTQKLLKTDLKKTSVVLELKEFEKTLKPSENYLKMLKYTLGQFNTFE